MTEESFSYASRVIGQRMPLHSRRSLHSRPKDSSADPRLYSVLDVCAQLGTV